MLFLIVFVNLLSVSLTIPDYVSETPCGPQNPSRTDLIQSEKFNSQQCYDREIEPQNNNINLGNVYLNTFVNSDVRTMFCVNFDNIKWDELKFRFKTVDTRARSMCRDLRAVKNIPSDKKLYYDSRWTNVGEQGRIGNFEYEYRKDNQISTRNFTFFIPNHDNLDTMIPGRQLHLFLYVDVTDLPHLKLYIQLPSQKALNYHNITDYDIYVMHTKHNKTTEVDVRVVSNEDAVNGIIEFDYYVLIPGTYYFTVTPFNKNDYGDGIDFHTSYTPNIVVPQSKTTLLVGIVGLSVILPFFFVVLCMLKNQLCFRRWNEPKILFVYEPTSPAYVKLINYFAAELKEKLGMDIMIDKEDIPKSADKDPHSWLSSAFYHASCVVFFISPEGKSMQAHEYKDLFNTGLQYISSEFILRSNKKFLVVSFAFSTNDLPKKLLNYKRYKLAEDTNKIIAKMLNEESLPLTQYKKLTESLKFYIDQVDKETFEEPSPKTTYVVIGRNEKQETRIQVDETLPLNANDASNNYFYQYKSDEQNFLGPQYASENQEEEIDNSDYKNDVRNLMLC